MAAGSKRSSTSSYVVEFGSSEWNMNLGGDFAGVDQMGSISWNWLGSGRAWCILPEMNGQTDYLLRLHAAPFAPFETELRELVVAAGDKIIHRRVVPAREPLVQAPFDSPGGKVALLWRALPLPGMEVFLNETVVARFEYEPRPDVQIRECYLRRNFRRDDKNVLFFVPNFAVSPEELGTPGDQRQLSFRLYRAEVSPLD